MSQPTNTALWLDSKRAAFRVREAPYTRPGPTQIVIRNRAIAVNPIDRMIPTIGGLIAPWIRYPFIAGSDVAGEVVEVGTRVTRFRVGDRALGFAAGLERSRNNAAEGAFQLYSIVSEHMATTMPPTLGFEAASVLPLAISTAACALFQKDFLGLDYPTERSAPQGKTLLIWGGSTSVGCNAIQLAAAAGYDVVTTCSPKNFDLVKQLGARQAFDYRQKNVVTEIISALDGRCMVGAIAIGARSGKACVDVLARCEGSKFVAMATPPATFDSVPRGRGRLMQLIGVMTRIVGGMIAMTIKARRFGVSCKMIWGGALIDNDVGPMVFARFLPDALASGRYRAAPEAIVVGHGLSEIPAALERQRLGASATKFVISVL